MAVGKDAKPRGTRRPLGYVYGLAGLLVLGAAATFASRAGARGGDGLLPIATTDADFFQHGTQPTMPGDVPIVGSLQCRVCHGEYDPVVEPYRNWSASMLGQSARDPLFWANLDIVNQDSVDAGRFCMRCHTPGAFLAGRTDPPDGSQMILEDFDGVSCNVCHRVVDPIYVDGTSPPQDEAILQTLADNMDYVPEGLLPPEGSNARYIISPADSRRGPIDPADIPFNPHFGNPQPELILSPHHQSSEMCWTCHDVSNPLMELQPDDTYVLGNLDERHVTGSQDQMFPLHRTYSEWLNSWYNTLGGVQHNGRFGGNHPTGIMNVCQDCHMPDQFGGENCNLGFPVRDRPAQHSFIGSNTWVLGAIRDLFDDSETGLSEESVLEARARNVDMLENASDLELEQIQSQIKARLTNRGGHKLPTGFPDGRRVWVNVKFFNGKGTPLGEYGAYDFATGDLSEHDTTVFEMVLGIDADQSVITGLPEGPTFHIALANVIEKDNRIPAIGHSNIVAEQLQTLPVGEVYANGQHWHDSFYVIPDGSREAVVTVYYQLTSKDFAEFLLAEGGVRGQTAYDLWVNHGMSAPVVMDMATLPLLDPADINKDGVVDFVDLLLLIQFWGSCPPPPVVCPPDINNDGVVNFTDLIVLLANWTSNATGACCFDDGSCLVLSGNNCVLQGGVYAGDNVSCVDANCPQPTGACCLNDGSCEVLTEADCMTQGGDYQGDGVECEFGTCPIPTGACCFDDGSCMVLSEAMCVEQSGTYAGIDVTCVDANCPQPTGACCFPDGSCTEALEQADCEGQGGTYAGDDVTCAAANCPQPTGACCFPDGSCTEALEQTDCEGQGGTYAGDDVTCAAANCPQPTGACCFPDGSCTEALEQTDCEGQGGTYAGDDVTCAAANCPQPTGACCFPDGSCTEALEQADCEGQGGTYAGDDVTCAAANCPQPTGACCFPDGSCTEALEQTDCEGQGGTYAGDDVACAAANCPQPTGACCFPDGSCTEALEQADCEGQGGTYAGDDVTCAAANCPQPTGACCFPDGSCTEALEQADCEGQGGTYAGDDVTCAAANCPQPTGACCFPDGSCTEALEQADCEGQGGTYAGDNVTCAAANCPQPTGACCFPDGSCTEALEQADCEGQGGTYAGDDVTCVAANCPQPTGACCLPDGSCGVLEAADCATQGGDYQGDDTTCVGDPCQTVVMFVVTDAAAPTAQEAARQTLMEAWGFAVQCITATDPQAAYDALIATSDVAYVSEEILSSDVDTKLTNAPIGVVNEEQALVDELRLAAGAEAPTQSQVDVVDNSHPISSPFGLGLLRVVNSAQPMSVLLTPLADGDVLMETDSGGVFRPSLLAVETGATLYPDGIAAGRRVHIPFGSGAFDVNELTDDGRLIMRRAIEWGAGLVPIAGACCFDAGPCLFLRADECAAQGGIYAGDDVRCIDAGCVGLTGACCFGDGSCVVLSSADCSTQGGAYAGDGVTCAAANCPLPTIIETRISTGSDDAEENSSNGEMDLTSSDLELPVSGDPTDNVGMRFTGLSIPAGVTIVEAWIQFQVDEVSTGSVAMTFRGQAADNAATFTTGTSNITSRARTSASVAWSPPDWSTVGEQGPNQRTPDLSAVVQEIVDRGGWAAGNAMVMIVDGTGRRTAESFNGVSSAAAQLHIAYTEIGACCLDSVNCVESSPVQCAAQGGTYRGAGVPCQGLDCALALGLDCCEQGPVRVLSGGYTAEDCSASNTDQEGGAACTDFAPMLDTVFIRATEKSNPSDPGGQVWFEGIVGLGEQFAIRESFAAGEASRLKDTTYVHVFDPSGIVLLQTVKLRTKCDKPLLTGDQVGSVLTLDSLGELEGSACDFGRPRLLTMLHTGESCVATMTGQGPGDAGCTEFGALPQTTWILATDKADPNDAGARVWFAGTRSTGDTYDVDAANASEANLSDRTWIHVFDVQGGTLLQTVEFKTKCDRPLYIGHQFGSALLLDSVGENE